VLVRAMMVIPFLFSGAILFLICLRRCFLDDNCSGPGVKSSGSATIPDAVFRPSPADTPRRYLAFSEAVNAFPP
jgi:hypothetical protein